MAKFSVKMLIVFGISSSYNLIASASRCRTSIFLCISEDCPDESIDLSRAAQRFELNQTARLLHASISNSYMEKKTAILAPST